ncbi:phosphoribosylanthranilate isomerase [Pseudalkalibacillus sp. Hm43]|uniref:phosphoribosylanthranilate isomerase n=1 Tax=Pseudalkalibacillus sp. Hm43 TaxID=3450742 RepID=UPI003F441EBD
MTKLKICGARSREDYVKIQKSSADYAGFIFAESKRRVAPQDVKRWTIGNQGISHVGVFVNPTLKQIKETLVEVDLDVLQLHGTESVSFIKQVKAQTDKVIWKALPHSEQTLDEMADYMAVVDGFVIDTKVKGKTGGTGIRFDWEAIPAYTELAKKNEKLCLIAGGIHPDNVQACLSKKPLGIDLSSGVEQNERKSETEISKLTERMNAYANSIVSR